MKKVLNPKFDNEAKVWCIENAWIVEYKDICYRLKQEAYYDWDDVESRLKDLLTKLDDF